VKLRIDLDGRVYDVDVEILEEDPPTGRPRYLPHHAPPTTVRSAHLAGGESAPAGAASPGGDEATEDESRVCRCPLAGVVNHIAVSVGQALQPNDLVMVLEAMKMETNVVADRAGTVKALRVVEGDGVKAGQVLMEYA
jgi:methylmalonyl-CoA carboxyltransferase small subunit